MDIRSASGTSISETANGLNDSNQLAIDPQRQSRDASVNDVADGLSNVLDDQNQSVIDNVEKKKICSEPYDEDDEEEGDEEEEIDITAEILAQSGHYKAEPLHTPAVSLCSNFNPVPAMKGSREKQRITPENLSLRKTLHVQDDQNQSGIDNVEKKKIYQEPHDEADEQEDDEEEGIDITAEILVQSSYYKAEPLHTPAVSLRSNLNLVSAMKGSREKQGITPENLSVTWSPDVYDPPPTSPSHFATSKTQRQRSENKSSAKNKQKGSNKPSTAGGGVGGGAGIGAKGKGKGKGKDKKQVRKYGGSSNKCFDSLDDDERLVDI